MSDEYDDLANAVYEAAHRFFCPHPNDPPDARDLLTEACAALVDVERPAVLTPAQVDRIVAAVRDELRPDSEPERGTIAEYDGKPVEG